MTLTWRLTSPHDLNTTLSAPEASGVCWQADATTCLVELPDCARFQVQEGIIHYACLGNLGDASIRMLGSGLPVAAAWIQRGYLAMHAAAVATPNGAIVLAGSSASGKSALAAELSLRGYPVLADEVVPLSLSDPGYLTTHALPDCNILLWQDAMTKLGLETANYVPLRPGLPRYIVGELGVLHPSLQRPKVQSIYLLASHGNPDIHQVMLEGSKRVLSVISATFNRYLPQPLAVHQQIVLQLAAKLASVPVYRLLRPHDGWSLSAFADRILEDITS